MKVKIVLDYDDGSGVVLTNECDTKTSSVQEMEDVYLSCKTAATAILDKVLG